MENYINYKEEEQNLIKKYRGNLLCVKGVCQGKKFNIHGSNGSKNSKGISDTSMKCLTCNRNSRLIALLELAIELGKEGKTRAQQELTAEMVADLEHYKESYNKLAKVTEEMIEEEKEIRRVKQVERTIAKKASIVKTKAKTKEKNTNPPPPPEESASEEDWSSEDDSEEESETEKLREQLRVSEERLSSMLIEMRGLREQITSLTETISKLVSGVGGEKSEVRGASLGFGELSPKSISEGNGVVAAANGSQNRASDTPISVIGRDDVIQRAPISKTTKSLKSKQLDQFTSDLVQNGTKSKAKTYASVVAGPLSDERKAKVIARAAKRDPGATSSGPQKWVRFHIIYDDKRTLRRLKFAAKRACAVELLKALDVGSHYRTLSVLGNNIIEFYIPCIVQEPLETKLKAVNIEYHINVMEERKDWFPSDWEKRRLVSCAYQHMNAGIRALQEAILFGFSDDDAQDIINISAELHKKKFPQLYVRKPNPNVSIYDAYVAKKLAQPVADNASEKCHPQQRDGAHQ